MPKMGESVAEATIISWLKNVGDKIKVDETVIEIATDKVDSEVPSSVEGILIEKNLKKMMLSKLEKFLD
jgi:2-oxoglutarate dehydrogenase E2 component (dihydrolipoamide succinyltransferase)